MNSNINIDKSNISYYNKFFKTKFRLKLLILISYIILVVFTEFFYRDTLFNNSDRIENYLQSIFNTKAFEILSFFGSQLIFYIIFISFYLFLPLNTSYSFLSVIVHTNYWNNILKIIYGAERPYWVFQDLIPSCNIGFGNPSGYSMNSTAVYLSVWHIFINQFCQNKIFLKYILLFFIFLFVGLIISSRLILGEHSINQVLYGFLLGIAVYLAHFWLFQMNKLGSRKFFQIFFSKKKKIYFAIYFSALFFLSILIYYIFPNF